MKFFEEGGWWLPDEEKELQQWLLSVNERVDGRLAYQYKKLDYAMRKVQSFDTTAVDVGAHAGLWTYYLAKKFRNVVAFEPQVEPAACWSRNVDPADLGSGRVRLHRQALGTSKQKLLKIRSVPGRTMKAAVSETGGVAVPATSLDAFHLTDVGFMKVDVEGYEFAVLKGAEQTILASRPTILVEQKSGNNQVSYGFGAVGAVDYLKSLGMLCRAEMDGDFLMYFRAPKRKNIPR